MEIKIELGSNFYNGVIMTFLNQGNVLSPNKIGALKVKINVISDENYKIHENYVEKNLTLSFKEFVLGQKIYFQHPRGRGEFELFESTTPGFKKMFNNLGLNEYYDYEEDEDIRGLFVLDIKSRIPYSKENELILNEFAQKLKSIEDKYEIKKLNRMI